MWPFWAIGPIPIIINVHPYRKISAKYVSVQGFEYPMGGSQSEAEGSVQIEDFLSLNPVNNSAHFA